MSQSTLRDALVDYLAVRRSVGFKLTRDGLLLGQFVAFCEQAGAERITRDLAVAWVTAPPGASPSWLGMRLTVIRGFAAWLQATDPATEVPERGWLPPRRRTGPFLYSDSDITGLMAVARQARWPLSAATYETLIGLLAVTGMRVGEVIRLDQDDVALDHGLITIRDSKLGKSRQVLLQPTRSRCLPSAPGCFPCAAGFAFVFAFSCSRAFRRRSARVCFASARALFGSVDGGRDEFFDV